MFTNNEPDLFSTTPEAISTGERMSPPAPYPLSLQCLENVFQREIALRIDITRRTAALVGELNAHPEFKYERINIDADINRCFLGDYVKRAKNVAVKELTTATAPFDPDLHPILDDAWGGYQRIQRNTSHQDGRNDAAFDAVLQAFSPYNVWAALLEHHDPKAQEKIACVADARAIAYEFGMLRRYGKPTEMKVVKGRVEIAITVHTEAGWDGKGPRRLGGKCLYKLGGAIQSALARQGFAAASVGGNLMRLQDEFNTNRRSVISRERVDLGSGADIVQGHKVFKLYLPMAVAQAINLFVAQHPEALEH